VIVERVRSPPRGDGCPARALEEGRKTNAGLEISDPESTSQRRWVQLCLRISLRRADHSDLDYRAPPLKRWPGCRLLSLLEVEAWTGSRSGSAIAGWSGRNRYC